MEVCGLWMGGQIRRMKRWYGIFARKDGSTLVEVMAAFVILLMIMAIFSRTMILAGAVRRRSAEIRREYQILLEACYAEEGNRSETWDSIEYEEMYQDAIFVNEEGGSFRIPVKLRSFAGTAGELHDVVSTLEEGIE